MHPEVIARRQRWVAVGVTILTLLLIVTWIVTLPARISKTTSNDSTGWRAILGDVPKGNLIDAEALINSPERKEQDAALLQSVTQVLNSTATTTPDVLTATTTKK